MLVLLISAWLLSNRSHSSATTGYVGQITQYANGHLAVREQREAVLAVAKEMKKAGSDEAKVAAKTAKAIEKVAENRSATPEDFEDALSQMRGYSEELQANVVKQRFQLKSELTRDQWDVLHTPSQ